MNKKVILAVGALVAVIGLFLGLYLAFGPRAQEEPADTQGTPKTITVTVVHSDGGEKVFTYQTYARYLGEVLAAEGLIVGAENDPGRYNTIDGEFADFAADEAYWALYINGEYAIAGADTTPVNDGDSFRWVYTVGYDW